MVTVLRANGLRVVIYLNDHLPAHVHVFGNGEVKINLIGQNEAPDLIWADGANRSGVRCAMRLVSEHQDALLERWENIYGRTD